MTIYSEAMFEEMIMYQNNQTKYDNYKLFFRNIWKNGPKQNNSGKTNLPWNQHDTANIREQQKI